MNSMLNLFDSSVRKYRSIRTMGVPLMTGVGKAMPRELILQAAKDLRMLGRDGKSVLMDLENEVDFLFDRGIHDIPWPKERWIEQICNSEAEDYIPRQKALLRAHSQAVFSLYEILAVEPRRGLRLLDLFDGKELLLIDLSLAETAEKGGLLATRVVSFEDVNFTSGIGMPFPAGDKRRLTENFTSLFEKKKSAMTWEQMMQRYSSYFFVEYKKGDREIEFFPAWKR